MTRTASHSHIILSVQDRRTQSAWRRGSPMRTRASAGRAAGPAQRESSTRSSHPYQDVAGAWAFLQPVVNCSTPGPP